MTRPLRTRMNTSAHFCTLLTHAQSRKVLSLTKPKGKIYKTKSLGHYITAVELRLRFVYLKMRVHVYQRCECACAKCELLYSHNQLYIHICMQKNIQHNKDERTQFFRKIYFSLYLKGLCVRDELETEQRLQHIDPHSSGCHNLSFSFSWAAQPRAWGPSLSAESWFPQLDLEH